MYPIFVDFFVEIIKSMNKKSCDKRVFEITILKTLVKYGHGNSVNLKHLV